jgi:hypothetical protein
MNQLPEGWTVEETRFMWALVDPSGTRRSFGLTEQAVRDAVALQKEFYVGHVSVIDSEKHVDL